ncbi:MAG: XRE family transcriptional regulator [Methanomassiliicoccales archaeon]
MTSADLLGKRVRSFRERLGLSVEDLAKNAGIEPALVHGIEEGHVYPAIGVLVKLSRALGQRVGTFVDDHAVDDPLIVRAHGRQEETAQHKGGAAGHYHYFSLGKGKTDRHMEPFFISIEASADKALSSHEGEELIIVVSGEVELLYGRDVQRLGPGDSVYYNSIVPHHVGATGGKAEIYAVIYTPF